MNANIIRRIVLSAFFTAFWLLLSYFVFMPALSFGSSGMIYINIILYLGFIGAIWVFNSKYNSWREESNAVNKVAIPIFVGAASILILLLVIGFFTTSEWVNTKKYRNLIGTIEETEFSSNIQPVATSQMIIVDIDMANQIGEKVLGSDPGLGSRAELGEFTLQPVRGKLYWIAPLLHSGFWKWNSFDEVGTPGYVKVSATDDKDFALVTKVNGKDLHIKYQPKSYFGQYLERHIYINGYTTSLYTDITFEVDDDWNPKWTATVVDTKIGLGGYDATGVLTIDPETGEIIPYTIASAPAWIDRIQPESNINNQVSDWGKYINGYFNWSDRDKLKVSDDNSFVLGSDGRAYLYYGLTSIGKEESTVGFVMVDTRTKKSHWFKQAGATEKAARRSAEGKVQEKNYVGSDGITYNIDGFPTYEFLLKDKGGLMKLIALVNVYQHTIIGIGETRQEAIQDYRAQMNSHGNSVNFATSEMVLEKVEGKIFRINFTIVKGMTYYNFIISSMPEYVFSAGNMVSDELSLTRDGDVVAVTYTKPDTGGVVTVSTFDNKLLNIKQDDIQKENESRIDSVRMIDLSKREEGVIDSKLNNLSKEEKKELLIKAKIQNVNPLMK